MITTKKKSFFLVLSLLMVLSACGGGDDTSTTETVEVAEEPAETLDSPATTAAPAPEEKKLKVGLVVGALGDRSFMDSAKRGFDMAVADLPIEGDFIEAEEAERAQDITHSTTANVDSATQSAAQTKPGARMIRMMGYTTTP